MCLNHITGIDVLLTAIVPGDDEDDGYSELCQQWNQDIVIPQFITDVYDLYFDDEDEVYSLSRRHG